MNAIIIEPTQNSTINEWSESCIDCVVVVNIAQTVPLVCFLNKKF